MFEAKVDTGKASHSNKIHPIDYVHLLEFMTRHSLPKPLLRSHEMETRYCDLTCGRLHEALPMDHWIKAALVHIPTPTNWFSPSASWSGADLGTDLKCVGL